MCALSSLSCQLDMTLITVEETLRRLCLAQASLWTKRWETSYSWEAADSKDRSSWDRPWRSPLFSEGLTRLCFHRHECLAAQVLAGCWLSKSWFVLVFLVSLASCFLCSVWHLPCLWLHFWLHTHESVHAWWRNPRQSRETREPLNSVQLHFKDS